MGLIDQINQMKEQGMQDDQIVQQLQNSGISPAEIRNALNQWNVKNAVSGNNQEDPNSELQVPELQTTEQPQEDYSNQNYNSEQYYGQEQQPQETYQEGYSNQAYPQQGYSQNSNTMEIVQQVITESTQEIEKSITKLQEFKTLAENQIQNIDKRLQNIENSFDKMQAAILEKIGSYGTNINSIKKEMSMMQDSFGKVINTALDKKSETHSTHKKTSKK